MRDRDDTHETTRDAGPACDLDHDQVGTVEVQILLSWFFETAVPEDTPTYRGDRLRDAA